MFGRKKSDKRHYIVSLDDISVEVERRRIKNIHLSIAPPDGRVRLSAPLSLTDEQIIEFLHSKRAWLQKHLQIIRDRPAPAVHQYLTGDTIRFLGQDYRLEVHLHERPPRIEIADDGTTIHLFVRQHYSVEMRGAVIEAWYRKQLVIILPALISRWEKTLGVHVNNFSIRTMRSRWGSCTVRTHNIRFNTFLAQKSLRCVEYVVAHELTHILVPNHSSAFYAILDGHFEDAGSLKKELKKF